MNIYSKLNAARQKFHSLSLKKSGHNKFAGYNYFELADFLIPALKVFDEVGLCAVVSFEGELATMRIVDVARDTGADAGSIKITSPMGSAALKGCHEVQNIGAVETYQRRYLWMAALEIVEHDAIDNSEPVPKVLADREDLKPILQESIVQAKEKKHRTKVMQVSRSIAEHLTQGREMGALQEWELATEDPEFATDVWHRLTTPEQNQIRELKDRAYKQEKADA